MKCHYEVLEVSRQADDNEIKAAYRKQALKWHPDKNLSDPEKAKEKFQLVQQAYEILSDHQERAWYDKQRENILRGPCSEYKDNSINLFQYFNASVFKGFGDDNYGFYTVYRTVFEKIAEEDMKFVDGEEDLYIPTFGNSTSSFELLSEFYNYWLDYSTKKSYAWLNQESYVNSGLKRSHIRLLEIENKKIRQQAKKEWNEQVRNMVAFVKKRDKRIAAHKELKAKKLLEDKQKRESLKKQKQLERQEQLSKASQPIWADFDDLQSQLKEIEEKYHNECDEISYLYCVLCSKYFKTSNAFKAHENTIKHRRRLEHHIEKIFYKKPEEILEEENYSEGTLGEEILGEENCSEETFSDESHLEETLSEDISESSEIKESFISKKKKKKNVIVVEEPDDIVDFLATPLDEDLDFCTKKSKKINKTKVKSDKRIEDKDEIVEEKELPVKSKKCKKPNPNVCATCGTKFYSRNKLFIHIKKTKHGVVMPTDTKSTYRKR